MTRDDADLETMVDRARRGDTGALYKLVERHRSRLIRMIHCRLAPRMRSRVGESDVMQETLIATSEAIRDYVPEDKVPFYAWLRRIAWRQLRRLCRDHVKAEKRSIFREQARLNHDSRDALCSRLMSLSTPSRRVAQAEVEQRLYTALDELAESDREILVLRYLEQLDSREIAAVLGDLSESGVRMRLMRAVRRIRELLDATESHP